MILFKITPVLLLAVIVTAEKKIELQDIEEDNLKSEKYINYETVDTEQEDGDGEAPDTVPLDYLKSGLLRYYKGPNPTQAPQQQRYIQQYAVTEPQERSAVTPAPQYGPPVRQEVPLNYLSNVPMHIYITPQYGESSNAHTEAHYTGQDAKQLANYPNPEPEQTHASYVDVQAYVAPTVKPHVQSYPSPVTYVSFSAQPTVATTPANIVPLVSYQAPALQYQTAVVAPPTISSNPQNFLNKLYYSIAKNTQGKAEEAQENNIDHQSYYSPQTEVSYTKSQAQDIPRYYNSRTPLREQYIKSNTELPRPSPLLLQAPPPHLAHIPKALPVHRPWSKPVYNNGGLGFDSFAARPIHPYGQHFNRGPTTLLDSYIPSRVQIEYLKRGIIKDPLLAYEALSSKRNFAQRPPTARDFEGGFLPNQVFHTADGGSFYGHFKRSPKVDRMPRS